MNKKTYEILAKWFARQALVNIEFQDNVIPHAILNENKIVMPSNISEGHTVVALCVLLHEACHLRYTKPLMQDLGKISTNKIRHIILNSCEDARINIKAQNILPLAKSFFKEVYDYLNVENHPDTTLRTLIYATLPLENFDERLNPKDPVYHTALQIRIHHVEKIISILNSCDCVARITPREIKTITDHITEIIKLLQLQEQQQPQQQDQQQDQQEQQDEQGQQDNQQQKQQQDGQQDGQEQGQEQEKNEDSEEQLGKNIVDQDPLQKIELKFDKPHSDKGNISYAEYSLQELTKAEFREALNVKLNAIDTEGTILDVENLHNFYTNNYDELFIDETTHKKKKSVLYFLLDQSGSMSCGRSRTLANTMLTIANILDELKKLEGSNIEYVIRGFDSGVYIYKDIDEFIKKYKPCGGTDIVNGFRFILDEIIKDNSIDGKKICVIITDGSVDPQEITEIQHMIKMNDSTIKTTIIGIDSPMNTATLIGLENIIMCPEMADNVIMNATQQLL
jgi:flagellar motor protein MotB